MNYNLKEGSIIYWPDFKFKDGGIADKLEDFIKLD